MPGGRRTDAMTSLWVLYTAFALAMGVIALGCGGDTEVGPVMPTFPADQVPAERLELQATATPTVSTPATPGTTTPGTTTPAAVGNLFGISNRERVELSGAVLTLTEEIERDPDVVWTYIERGDVLMRLGELDAAVEDYTAALRIGGESQEVYASRAVAHALNGNMARAQEDLDTAALLGYPPAPLQELFESMLQNQDP